MGLHATILATGTLRAGFCWTTLINKSVIHFPITVEAQVLNCKEKRSTSLTIVVFWVVTPYSFNPTRLHGLTTQTTTIDIFTTVRTSNLRHVTDNVLFMNLSTHTVPQTAEVVHEVTLKIYFLRLRSLQSTSNVSVCSLHNFKWTIIQFSEHFFAQFPL
jgi:hypothetical protein